MDRAIAELDPAIAVEPGQRVFYPVPVVALGVIFLELIEEGGCGLPPPLGPIGRVVEPEFEPRLNDRRFPQFHGRRP